MTMKVFANFDTMMIRRVSKVLLLLVIPLVVLGANDLRRILRLLEKEDLEKALELIEESIAENPINPGIKWIYAELMATDSLEIYDLDRARLTINEAIADYSIADEDILRDMEKAGVDSIDLQVTWIQIRNLYYTRTVHVNSIEGFNTYMRLYPAAPQLPDAIQKRDSLAFREARSRNTWQSFKQYVETYPNAVYADEATERYDLLLFQERTSSGEVADYEKFVGDHPTSPYLQDAYRFIFRYGNLDHDPEGFLNFALRYPDALESKRALDIMFHLDSASFWKNSHQLGGSYLDSVLARFNDDKLSLVPIRHDGKYGFMDLKGRWRVLPVMDSVLVPDLYCGVYTQPLIPAIVDDQKAVYTRDLTPIWMDPDLQTIRDIGIGVILVSSGNRYLLLHATGYRIIDQIDDAKLLARRWLLVKRNEKWAVLSLTGVLLTDFEFDMVSQEGNFFVFHRGDDIALTNKAQLLQQVGETGLTLEYKFDDMEVVNQRLIIGFKDDRECLVNENMTFDIPWGRHVVYPHPQIHYVREDSAYRIYNETFSGIIGSSTVNNIVISEEWLAVKEKDWKLIHLDHAQLPTAADSVKLLNGFAAFVSTGTGNKVVFPNGQSIRITRDHTLKNLRYRSPDASFADYLIIGVEKRKSVWDRKGRFLFQEEFDELDNLTEHLFRISRDEKHGVITDQGQWLVDIQYEFISYRDSLIITLRDGKIGALDLKNFAELPERFEATISRFGSYYKTRNETGWGAIDSLGTEVVPFGYDDMEFLSDSTAWVLSSDKWALLNFEKDQVSYENILDVDLLWERTGELYYRILSTGGYGIYSNVYGEIINANFSDILTVTSETASYFWAEHIVPEADYYVVVAYNVTGTRLYSEAYRASEYEFIYCE